MINQKNVAKFIQQYNDFEKIISASNAVQARTVLEFEESLTLKDAEANQKLKVCRIVRNYIQHNDVNFVEPSKEMIDFIANLSDYVRSLEMSANDVLKKLTPLTLSDTITDAAKKLSRNKLMPVVDKRKICIGIVTDETIRVAVSKGTRPSSKLSNIESLIKSATIISKDIPVKNITENSVVTKDGTKNGQYVGVVII